MIYLTRKFDFCASHRLYKEGLSDEENMRIFGKCSNPNGHGHNYILYVTVCGEVDPTSGFVIDFTELKDIVESEIISKVDHKNLNLDVDFMRGILPSAENIAVQFWKILEPVLKGPKRKLYSIKLEETVNNTVLYKGE